MFCNDGHSRQEKDPEYGNSVLPEAATFQSWLTDSTFYTYLLMEIMQKPLINCQKSLITLQEVSAFMASLHSQVGKSLSILVKIWIQVH